MAEHALVSPPPRGVACAYAMLRPAWELRALTDALCADAGFTPRVAFEGDDLRVVSGFVSAGLGVAVMPAGDDSSTRAREGQRLVPLSDEGAFRDVGVAWSKTRRLLPSADLFRRHVLRARARNGAGTENRVVPRNLTLADVPTGVALRDAIYNERTRELIWEMKRWFDLVRRDTQDPGYFANELRAHDPEARRRNDPATQRFRKLLPLPQREIDLLQGVLCQNKGYGGSQCEVDIEISK